MCCCEWMEVVTNDEYYQFNGDSSGRSGCIGVAVWDTFPHI